MLVFLTGFMGSGKTTAGRIAAMNKGFAYIDLDAVIEIKAGKSISEIFRDYGQEQFRIMETEALHEMAGRTNTIVAVGGGCPCVNDNMEWMMEHGMVIYLKAHHGILFHRLMYAKKDRPLIASLTDVQLMEYIVNQLQVREHYYSRTDHTIETASETAEVLSQRISEMIFSVLPESVHH
jgi:shikimate kinase